jgi:hypothetical protein
MIRVVLPAHLRALAHISGEVHLEVDPPVTQRTVLDALETCHPTLTGTMRDHTTKRRRPFVRFYADTSDLTGIESCWAIPESARCWSPLSYRRLSR